MSESPKIIAFSGKKSSGKSSAVNFVHAVSFVMDPIHITNKAFVNEQGQLVVNEFGNREEDVLDLCRRDRDFVEFATEHIWPFLKRFSFADPLKEMCVDLLGLTEEQVFGTEEQKNTLVQHLLWENFPLGAWVDDKGNTYTGPRKKKGDTPKFGPMTSREVQQTYGTEIFRKHYPRVHAKSCVRRIQKANPAIGAVVDSLRFADELEEVQAIGGKVVRFTRQISEDEHDSEKALDPERFDWSRFDAVIDNKELTLDETNERVFSLLLDWNWIQTA